ncbi:hypothetical protein LJR066_005736 [Acidovorax sp. LjRoot66]|uniref:hypothetical protein n=1 Tax=Acidovorax sp. LjRoot66 TaxID=3342334 RepID=UPI003ECC640F
MSDAIADAPVRANRAPTRPKAVAAPAPAPQAQAIKEDSEATLLVRTIAGHINDLLIPISSNWPWEISSVPGREHIIEADSQLCDLWKTEAEWAAVDLPARPALSDHMSQIAGLLHRALESLSAPAEFPCRALAAQLLVENAARLMARLQAAYDGLPGTMDELRELATFAGARHHREQPRPPIRRTPDFEGDLATAAGAVAAIGRNMPGHVVFATKEELATFVDRSAASVACLNVMLVGAVESECMAAPKKPDASFVAEFAAFVSDQMFEHQQAVGALLKAGGAA